MKTGPEYAARTLVAAEALTTGGATRVRRGDIERRGACIGLERATADRDRGLQNRRALGISAAG